jgi:hypothetical protein
MDARSREETAMKKAIVGLAAVGAIVGLRRVKQKMREHCAQMAADVGGADLRQA